jgi:EAL domain-containing protein (putative c-di-GMP-specific phosphodiesterase class I)
MSARKLTGLNDRILVHEEGERVQPPLWGSRFQTEEKRGARLGVSRLCKHDRRQIPHSDLPIREERAKLNQLYSGCDGDPQCGGPQRFISGEKPKSDKISLQRIFARDCECIGFEALMRWNHPHRSVMNAEQFLDVAQRAGITDALDTLMTDSACHALRWLSNVGMPHISFSFSFSFNISTAQLSHPRLLNRLETALAKFDVARHLLRIELLESTLLDEWTTHFLTNVNAMVNAGFVVELDDFGTAHAAIAALRKFHVSQIKINRSSVRHVDTDEELKKLTAAIIGLANSLDINVLAEGVETQ